MFLSLSNIRTQKWFTILELIVGMTIFSIGMTGILALLSTTIQNSLYSRHEIVAANLLREQIELVKNTRNSNIRNFIPFNSLLDGNGGIFTGWVYIIENDFSSTRLEMNTNVYGGSDGKITKMPVKMERKTIDFSSSWATFDSAQLFLDSQGRYIHDKTISATGTQYASYMIISPISYKDTSGGQVPVEKSGSGQWYILDARVLVKSSGQYKEYDLKGIVTDWK